MSDRKISKLLYNISNILGINTTTAASAIESILEAREIERVGQVRRFREYYDGKSIPYMTEEGELPHINICYSVVEKSTAWLVGEPPVVKGRSDIQPLIGEIVNEVLENSGGDSFWRESAVEGGTTGDCVIKVDFDPMVNEGQGGIVLKVMDSERTFVEYLNVGQSRRLNRVMIVWDELDESGNVETYLEVWSKDTVQVYPPGPVASTLGIQFQETELPIKFDVVNESGWDSYGNEFKTYKNPFGELPFVHIPNILVPANIHGRSDLHDIWVLNREYNEQLLSYKDNVDYHGNPITVMKGVALGDIEKGADKIWANVPKEADIFNLEVVQTHEAILKYMELLKDAMGHASIPTYLLATDKQLQSDISAASLKLAFLPLVELTERKRVTYGKGYREAFEMALRFTNAIFDLGLNVLDSVDPRTAENLLSMEGKIPEAQLNKIANMRLRPFYRLDIEFKDHMPRNRTQMLSDIEVELRNSLETIPGALKRLQEQDVDNKLVEILENAEFVRDLQILQTPPPPEAGIEDPSDLEGAQSDVVEEEKESDGDKGGRGRKKRQKTVNEVEDTTGQSAERTATQRATKGQGDV